MDCSGNLRPGVICTFVLLPSLYRADLYFVNHLYIISLFVVYFYRGYEYNSIMDLINDI